ncbi:hypothetical protein ABZ508_02700 [Streptomyces lavendulocolor]|uniref:Uncharacterized protein n=1 Tax=Streptomyces lavendulocolor TaxID=67316 RepID=A0ABV2W1W0_9ACTN
MDAATHLRQIARTWPRLTDALDEQPAPAWPPHMGIAALLTDPDDDDVPQRGARDGSGTGECPTPIRLEIVDLMTHVETRLVALADAIAATNQRSQIQPAPANRRTAIAPRVWTAADRHRRDKLAAADATDPQRWRLTGHRTATYAALWLCARVEGIRGPQTPLTEQQRHLITRTAAAAVDRIDRALQLARLARATGETCACGGELLIEGGDGQPPTLRCGRCERSITAALTAA